MHLQLWLMAGFLTMTTAFAHPPAPASTPAQELHRLFADEWERGLRDSPETASYQGDTRFDDRWTDLSPAAIAARHAADRAALARLRAIERATLSEADQLNYDTFAWQLERQVERQRFREWLMPLEHQGGVQTADTITEVMPFSTPEHYRRWIARLEALPRRVDQTIALMAEGARAGLVPPRVLMERVPAQIAAQVVDDPVQSPLYRPFSRMPAGLASGEALARQAQAVIREQVVPAYRRLQQAFANDYLPRTRTTTAAAALPDGQAYYDFLARWYTSTELSADQIHAIGLAEVARLRAAMEQVKAEAGFSGTLAEFFTFLRTDPQFYCRTPQELLRTYRDVAKRIDPELTTGVRHQPL